MESVPGDRRPIAAPSQASETLKQWRNVCSENVSEKRLSSLLLGVCALFMQILLLSLETVFSHRNKKGGEELPRACLRKSLSVEPSINANPLTPQEGEWNSGSIGAHRNYLHQLCMRMSNEDIRREHNLIIFFFLEVQQRRVFCFSGLNWGLLR